MSVRHASGHGRSRTSIRRAKRAVSLDRAQRGRGLFRPRFCRERFAAGELERGKRWTGTVGFEPTTVGWLPPTGRGDRSPTLWSGLSYVPSSAKPARRANSFGFPTAHRVVRSFSPDTTRTMTVSRSNTVQTVRDYGLTSARPYQAASARRSDHDSATANESVETSPSSVPAVRVSARYPRSARPIKKALTPWRTPAMAST
jgi:hypothetical protein